MLASTTTPNLIDYVTAIGAIATPLVVLLLTGVGWSIRNRQERIFKMEERLQEDRIATYNEILEPFIILLMADTAWNADPKNKNKDKNVIATQKMLSLDYRKMGFKLSLIGSDEVVTAYNNMMQYFFHRDQQEANDSKDNLKDMMRLLGQFLLEIRKSMGNEASKLDAWDMLEWFITDARRLRD